MARQAMHIFLGIPSFLSQVLLLFLASAQRTIVTIVLCLCVFCQSEYTAWNVVGPFFLHVL